jgi:hypothetical protein
LLAEALDDAFVLELAKLIDRRLASPCCQQFSGPQKTADVVGSINGH